MRIYTEQKLSFIFGAESTGRTPEKRAATSSAVCVRTQNELLFYRDMDELRECSDDQNPQNVFIVSASDALRVYGMEAIEGAIDRGFSVIKKIPPGDTVRETRHQKGWTQEELAQRSRLTTKEVEEAEDTSLRSNYKLIFVPICQALGLDPLTLGL